MRKIGCFGFGYISAVAHSAARTLEATPALMPRASWSARSSAASKRYALAMAPRARAAPGRHWGRLRAAQHEVEVQRRIIGTVEQTFSFPVRLDIHRLARKRATAEPAVDCLRRRGSLQRDVEDLRCEPFAEVTGECRPADDRADPFVDRVPGPDESSDLGNLVDVHIRSLPLASGDEPGKRWVDQRLGRRPRRGVAQATTESPGHGRRRARSCWQLDQVAADVAQAWAAPGGRQRAVGVVVGLRAERDRLARSRNRSDEARWGDRALAVLVLLGNVDYAAPGTYRFI